MPQNLVELIKEEDFDPFLQNNKLVLVKFSASGCPPCHALQKNIEELLKQLEVQQKDLVVLKVDAEKFPRLISKNLNLVLSVKSLPTFFLFHQGKMIKKDHGNRDVQWLREFIAV